MMFAGKRSKFCSWLVVLGYWMLPCLFSPSPVLADEPSSLAGPAFSDPAVTVAMPASWRATPIKYDDWAKGADVAVSLDQHLYDAIKPLIDEFARRHGLKIAVNKGTCGVTAGLLARKAVDVGGFCCPPGDMDRLPGLRFHTVGISALAILLNTANPVENLTFSLVQQIFQGKIYFWEDLVGVYGKDSFSGPIQPIGRLHCKLRPGHWRLLLSNENLFSPRMVEVGTIRDMMLQVARIDKAVGYEVLSNIESFQLQDKVKGVKINGFHPGDAAALARGDYPFYRVYNLTSWEGQDGGSEVAQKLVSYLLDHAEEIDRRFYMIPAKVLQPHGWRFRQDELAGGP